ncbi:enoyl-CoA hydratase/isomerase family protein [Lacibacterium aquatile]|uniref:Enoyl-CoA hydratase/isomerase family protein n=1 Tax=Lacibacterium aquatile TaxID=1168082 RepID=A0ABW5DYU1_9PROT
MAETAPVLLSQRLEGGIHQLILNRPDKMNVLNAELWQALYLAFETLSADASVRCILLRGAGNQAFCAGGDISEFQNLRATPDQAKDYAALMYRTLAALKDCPHPMVAQISGNCIGGGVELAMLCDIRIAGRSSRYGIPINRLGFVMSYPELDGLIAVVGRSAAMEILLEGRIFDAEEALRIGLVSRLVADEAVEAEAMAAAGRVASGAPLVNRWHKKFARRLSEPMPLSPPELAEGFACFETEDYRRGVSAFVAKVKPQFEGN